MNQIIVTGEYSSFTDSEVNYINLSLENCMIRRKLRVGISLVLFVWLIKLADPLWPGYPKKYQKNSFIVSIGPDSKLKIYESRHIFRISVPVELWTNVKHSRFSIASKPPAYFSIFWLLLLYFFSTIEGFQWPGPILFK